MHQTNSMIYRMGQEVGFILHRTNSMMVLSVHSLICSMIPQRRAHVPFVAAARYSIPQATTRLTTASTRGNLRGRGRGRGRSKATPARRNTSAATAAGAGNKRTVAAAGASSSSRPPPTRGRNYNTGPCSAHYLLFSDDEQGGQTDGEGIPECTSST
jgi:hypothetical protein